MSFRLTFILLILLVATGGYALLLTGEEEEALGPPAYSFYDLDRNLIDRIAITYFDKTEVFARNKPGDWRFDTKDGPPTSERFIGTNLIASGGASTRALTHEATRSQLEEYGLLAPPFQMEVHLDTGDSYCVRLGGATPSGNDVYGQVQAKPCNEAFRQIDPNVYLMPQIWEEVLAEHVTDPPIPATPTPQNGSA